MRPGRRVSRMSVSIAHDLTSEQSVIGSNHTNGDTTHAARPTAVALPTEKRPRQFVYPLAVASARHLWHYRLHDLAKIFEAGCTGFGDARADQPFHLFFGKRLRQEALENREFGLFLLGQLLSTSSAK